MTRTNRPLRWLRRGLLALLAVVVLALSAATVLLRGSLAPLDGEAAIPGLGAPVALHRDALGVLTVEASSEADAMRALGYAHAQERYFEMDLMRRTAAGELAALFGPIALEMDRRHRVHRMRARVEAHLDAALGDRRGMAEAYVAGVNAGLSDLDVRPWPYLLLGVEPEPWRLADTALAGYAMYFDLQDATNARELALWRVRPHLPDALFELVTHDGSSWDAPLVGGPRGDAELPSAAQVDLRQLPSPPDDRTPALPRPPAIGSNNFAVSGALTADGRAIVADDMHLGLRAPNIWFRARLRYPDPAAPGGAVDATGFTLPGLPALVVGSNGHVAWGFTNSYGDFLDWRLERGCAGAGRDGCVPARTVVERIAVKGEAHVELAVEETAWGPVLHHEENGDRLALRWAAHLPGSLTLGLSRFLRADSLDEALHAADHAGIPGQNLVIGDRHGRIAWRLLGARPVREGCPATLTGPADGDPEPALPCQPWRITTADAPAVVDPAPGRLWTANSRVVDGAMLDVLGDGGHVLGARARQIRDGLFARERFGEHDLLAIQLDDRAVFLERWWRLLQQVAEHSDSEALDAVAAAARTWDGRASVDSVSYRLVRGWRLEVHDRIAAGLLAPAREALGEAVPMPAMPHLEGVAWPLVTQQPDHLLPARYRSWDELFEDAARALRDELADAGPLAERTWGERNTAAICHPLAAALPGLLRSRLCMPADPLPGDSHMPRVQAPSMGASQRMVVSPGHEEDGIVHMPGGQSGHPLSPFWGAGHGDWAEGRPTPFLPGETRHTLRLVPAAPRERL
jgi:penicillin amidase